MLPLMMRLSSLSWWCMQSIELVQFSCVHIDWYIILLQRACMCWHVSQYQPAVEWLCLPSNLFKLFTMCACQSICFCLPGDTQKQRVRNISIKSQNLFTKEQKHVCSSLVLNACSEPCLLFLQSGNLFNPDVYCFFFLYCIQAKLLYGSLSADNIYHVRHLASLLKQN